MTYEQMSQKYNISNELYTIANELVLTISEQYALRHEFIKLAAAVHSILLLVTPLAILITLCSVQQTALLLSSRLHHLARC